MDLSRWTPVRVTFRDSEPVVQWCHMAGVRFDDPTVQEVTLDINTGRVLHVGERNDVFLEKLHSGEIFGDGWVLLTDLAAVALALLLLSGYWLWLYPRARS